MTGREFSQYYQYIPTYRVTYTNKQVVINILDNYRQTVAGSLLILAISSGGRAVINPKQIVKIRTRTYMYSDKKKKIINIQQRG